MGKTNKSFRHDDSDDYEDDGRRMFYEKNARKHERLVQQALKTKNVDLLITKEDEEDDSDLPDFMKKNSCYCCQSVFLEGEKQIKVAYDPDMFICEECNKLDNKLDNTYPDLGTSNGGS